MNEISCSEGCCVGTNKIRDVLLSGYSKLSVVMATARDRMPVPLLERQKQNSFAQS